MFKNMLALGILAASFGAQAGMSYTAFCPAIDNAIVHFEQSKGNNHGEIVSDGGKWVSVFDKDAGDNLTYYTHTVHKASTVGNDGVVYTLVFSKLKGQKVSFVSITNGKKSVAFDTCQVLHEEQF